MRVLILTNYYPPYEVGGYEQLCRDVAERLTQRDHKTFVLTSDRGTRDQKHVIEESNVYRVLTIQPDYTRRLNAAWQFFLTRSWAERHNLRWLHKVLAQVRPDVVFVWNIQGLTRRMVLDAEAAVGVKVAYWLAGYSPAEPDEFWHYWMAQPKVRSHLGHLKAKLRQIALARMRREGQPMRPVMAHVAVVSHFMRRKGLAEGTLPDHTQVIYNGVEVEQFVHPVRPRGQEPLQLLQAGRLSEDKGAHTAIEAVGYLVQEHGLCDVHLTVAGSGRPDYQTRLNELIERFGIGNFVTMTGWLPRTEIPALINQSHILLLPTPHPEPFARVVLEAMAGGLGVVAANTGGTSEIVHHGKTGLLFPADDSHSLAAELLRLAQDDDLRQQLAVNGQQIVREQFSMEHMVDEIEIFLKQALEN